MAGSSLGRDLRRQHALVPRDSDRHRSRAGRAAAGDRDFGRYAVARARCWRIARCRRRPVLPCRAEGRGGSRAGSGGTGWRRRPRRRDHDRVEAFGHGLGSQPEMAARKPTLDRDESRSGCLNREPHASINFLWQSAPDLSPGQTPRFETALVFSCSNWPPQDGAVA